MFRFKPVAQCPGLDLSIVDPILLCQDRLVDSRRRVSADTIKHLLTILRLRKGGVLGHTAKSGEHLRKSCIRNREPSNRAEFQAGMDGEMGESGIIWTPFVSERRLLKWQSTDFEN